jgi:hypothetical protein
MGRRITAAAVFACLLLAGAGCGGSGDSSTSTDSETAGSAAAGKDKGSSGGATDTTANEDGSGSGSGSGAQGKDEHESSGSGGSGGVDPAEFKAPKGGDDSIQTFGTEAEGDEKDAVVSAMRSFLRALAASDYAKVCAGLTASNREQLQAFLKAKKETGNCTTVLSKVLVGGANEAKKAANGAIYQVRVEDENAFVLFTPEGGKASYFVMKREGDEWKSTSIGSGAPINTISLPGQ